MKIEKPRSHVLTLMPKIKVLSIDREELFSVIIVALGIGCKLVKFLGA